VKRVLVRVLVRAPLPVFYREAGTQRNVATIASITIRNISTDIYDLTPASGFSANKESY
jgi:hypothetical protein